MTDPFNIIWYMITRRKYCVLLSIIYFTRALVLFSFFERKSTLNILTLMLDVCSVNLQVNYIFCIR